MRLLPKKQVASQIASQSKAQIDEGVLIAKKIDALRQTLASLEKQHSNFADKVKDELHEQTKDLVREIEMRRKELIDILENRRKAIEPLDGAWAEVKAKLKQIDVTLDDIASRNKKIQLEEAKVLEKSKDAKNSLSRIRIREKELERAYAIADEIKSANERFLKSNEEEYSKKIKDVDIRLDKVALLERELDGLRVHNEDNRLRNEEREKELNSQEGRINDRYATLERTINRLKK